MKINDETLLQWIQIKAQIESLVEQERKLRIAIASEVLGDKTEGTKTDTIHDIKFQATAVINYTIDRAELDLVMDELTEDDKAALRYKPELAMKAYRQLPDTSKLKMCVTAKPGLPQLKVV